MLYFALLSHFFIFRSLREPLSLFVITMNGFVPLFTLIWHYLIFGLTG